MSDRLEPAPRESCRYGGNATIYTSICQVHHMPKLVCEITALRAENVELRACLRFYVVWNERGTTMDDPFVWAKRVRRVLAPKEGSP